MATNQLLLDFLTTDLPLTELAERHGLSLPDLLAWADSPETVRIFDDIQRIATRRSALIAAESSAKALGNLAQLSLALARRAELANNPADPTRPKPPSITALESSRKACAALLRIVPKLDSTHPRVARSPAQTRDQSSPQAHIPEPQVPTPPRPTPANTPIDVLAILAQTTDSSAAAFSPVHPLTSSPVHTSRPANIASRAGVIPTSSRHSPLPSAGIPTG